MTTDVNQLEHCYQRALRSLLWRTEAKPLQAQICRLLEQCRQRAESLPPQQAYQQVYQDARQVVIQELVERRQAACAVTCTYGAAQRRPKQLRQLLEKAILLDPSRAQDQPDFHCDAGLGGTARWLRAAGYDACFWPGIDDDHLLEKVLGSSALLLTTDRRLMDRAVIRWGVVPALLVPLSLGGKRGQFGFVLEQLELSRRPARCMACGGLLQMVQKEAVRERIPPKTFPRCHEYYECQGCGRLLWRGTHWREIEKLLPAGHATAAAESVAFDPRA